MSDPLVLPGTSKPVSKSDETFRKNSLETLSQEWPGFQMRNGKSKKKKKEQSEDFIRFIVINWKEEQSGRKWAH